MVLPCVSPMANDVEYLFIVHFYHPLSSLAKCMFRFCTHFLNWVVYFLATELRVKFWIQIFCQIRHLQIFSPSL